MRRLRVLEMIDRPFLGGGQITVFNLAAGLDPESFETAVCSGGGGPLEAELRQRGIPHIPFDFPRVPGRGVRKLAAVLEEGRFDIVHTHGGVAGLAGRAAAHRARIPAVVHTLHGIHYLHYRNPVLKRAMIVLERRCSKSTDAVVVVSEADRAAARRLRLAPPERIKLIRNGVPTRPEPAAAIKDKLRRDLGLEGGPVVGAVSRLHRQKGVIHFIGAAARILRERPDARFVVVGGGPLRKAIEAAIGRAGLCGKFRLAAERPDARDILSLFDVFVLPSLWEGLPYVLVEAAALGKPIVVTDIDGVREVLKDGETGLRVPVADPEALARAVLRLLDDGDLAARLGNNARAAIPKLFSMDRMMEETGALYLEIRGGL
ncbi:MAG: glycosyltransferase [Acidobacteriota bacterium]|nr:glycosyltransferase [Acidobacteriota bacterium]